MEYFKKDVHQALEAFILCLVACLFSRCVCVERRRPALSLLRSASQKLDKHVLLLKVDFGFLLIFT